MLLSNQLQQQKSQLELQVNQLQSSCNLLKQQVNESQKTILELNHKLESAPSSLAIDAQKIENQTKPETVIEPPKIVEVSSNTQVEF